MVGRKVLWEKIFFDLMGSLTSMPRTKVKENILKVWRSEDVFTSQAVHDQLVRGVWGSEDVFTSQAIHYQLVNGDGGARSYLRLRLSIIRLKPLRITLRG